MQLRSGFVLGSRVETLPKGKVPSLRSPRPSPPLAAFSSSFSKKRPERVEKNEDFQSERSEQIQKIHIEKRFPIEKPETRRISIIPLARSNAVQSNCFLPMPFSPSGVCARPYWPQWAVVAFCRKQRAGVLVVARGFSVEDNCCVQWDCEVLSGRCPTPPLHKVFYMSVVRLLMPNSAERLAARLVDSGCCFHATLLVKSSGARIEATGHLRHQGSAKYHSPQSLVSGDWQFPPPHNAPVRLVHLVIVHHRSRPSRLAVCASPRQALLATSGEALHSPAGLRCPARRPAGTSTPTQGLDSCLRTNGTSLVCTYNVRSLRAEWRQAQIQHLFTRLESSSPSSDDTSSPSSDDTSFLSRVPAVLCLQETRLEEPPPCLASVANCFVVPATPVMRKPSPTHTSSSSSSSPLPIQTCLSTLKGGLLVMCSKQLAPPRPEVFEDRGLSLLFSADRFRFRVRIINVYAPQCGMGTEVISSWWCRFTKWCLALRKDDLNCPTPTVLLITGDLNADLHHKPLHPSSMLVTAFCNALEVTYKQFTSSAKKYPFSFRSQRPSGIQKSLLDYILVSSRFATSLTDVRILRSPLCPRKLDHSPVSGRLHLHLQHKPKAQKVTPRPDWSTIKDDANFDLKVFAQMDRLLEGPRLLEACAGWLGHPWFEVLPSYSTFAEAVRISAPPPAPCPPPTEPHAPVVVRTLADIGRARSIAEDSIEEAVSNFVALASKLPSQAYKHIQKLCSTKINAKPTASSPEDIVAHFRSVNGETREYRRTKPFAAVLNAPLVSGKKFTMNELTAAIHSLKTGKATGLDEMPAEAVQKAAFRALLLRWSNEYLEGSVPPEVLVTNLIMVPKKGDLSIVANYRGIALLSVFLKLINLLLLRRLKVLDCILRTGQSGFRPCRSTNMHVLALALLGETSSPLTLLYIDFRKAFDSVSHSALRDMLAAYQIPHNLMSCVLQCYTNHVVQVAGVGGVGQGSPQYDLKSGVLQGDTLAPYLFIMLLNLLLEEAITPDVSFPLVPTPAVARPTHHTYNLRPRDAPAVFCLQELAFADDIAVPAVSPASAALVLRRLQKLSEEVGLELNVAPGKTEIQVLRGPAEPNNEPLLDLHGTKITECSVYKYLGSHPTNLRKALADRISLAWFALRRLKPVWSSTRCPLRHKLDLLRALATSILLYCCEIWTTAIASIADRAYHSMLKYVTCSFSEPTVDLMARCRIPHVSSIAAERQINLVGHALRMVCPLTFMLNHKLPLLRSAPLHKLLQRRIQLKDRSEWATYAEDRHGWKGLARDVACEREEAVQLSLLRARRRRWLSPQRIENRIYLLILEASTDLLPMAHLHELHRILKPYAMHKHQNVFAKTTKKNR